MIRIINLIPTLDIGGAEAMLLKLSEKIDKNQFENLIVCIGKEGSLSKSFYSKNLKVFYLGMDNFTGIIVTIFKLKKLIHNFKPDILITWLHFSDLLGLIIKFFFPKLKIIWNLRCSTLSLNSISLKNIILVKFLALFSKIPNLIIANSFSGIKAHKKIGYKNKKFIIVPNGFDSNLFKPNPKYRTLIRKKIGLKEKDVLIGFIGKDTKIKGFDIFLNTAKVALEFSPNLKFILVGPGLNIKNEIIKKFFLKNNIKDKFIFYGTTKKIHEVLVGLDLLAITSRSEGFPNILGEAMACGVPCVSTNVGDCENIIGCKMLISNSFDSKALSKLWHKTIINSQNNNSFSINLRKRISDKFSLNHCITKYEKTFKDIHEK